MKSMKYHIWIVGCLLMTAYCFGQHPSDIKRTYHWHFGNGAGLDFSGGTPVPITNSAITVE